MVVTDFFKRFDVTDNSELRKILEIRYKHDANCFWLSETMESYPRLAILAKGDLNTLQYIPAIGVAGFRSLGTLQENRAGNTTFYLIDDGEKEIVPNEYIVLSSSGLSAAEEFMATQDLPKAIEWLEL